MPFPARLVFLYYAFIFSTIFSTAAMAAPIVETQTNNGSAGQIPQDQSDPTHNLQEFRPPGTIPSLGDILKNIHGSYSVSFMGPSLSGATNETYNIYIPDQAPLQLYHTLKLGYQVSPDLQIGVNESIVNNVANNVTGFPYDSNGNPVTPAVYGTTFEWYDPNIYFDLPNLIKVPGWSVFTTASFSLPVSSGSISINRVTQFIIQQNWTKNSFGSSWSYGIHLYLNPQFYADPIPDGYTNRETFSFSFGPLVDYHVSDLMTLYASATFDIQHNSPDPAGFFDLTSGLPDYAQIGTTLFPNIFPLWMSIGGYFQWLVWNPAWNTSILGAKFSIGF